jgi:hypothetical protein
MNEKTYYYSKQKLLLRMLVAFAIFFPCAKLIYGALATGEIRRIGLLILVALVALAAALFIALSIPLLFAKAKKEIEFNEQGIYSAGNNGDKIGLIPWHNISQVTQNKIDNKKYICVHVRDIAPFSNTITAKEKRTILATNHIALLIDNRNVADELPAIFAEAQRFLKTYGTPEPNQQDNPATAPSATPPAFSDLTVPVLDAQVFMHYHTGLNRPRNFEDPNWLHEHVFFWPFTEKPDEKSLPAGFGGYNARYFVFAKPLPDLLKLSKVTATTGNEEKYFFNAGNKPFAFDQLFKAGNLKYITLINKRQHVFYKLDNIYALAAGNEGETAKKEIVLSHAIAADSVYLFQINR